MSQALQLILSLSILIVLHELGHFIPARLFKTRVEKFYLFFDPWFSLFKFKRGGTEYGVGWLPLGGYVKISGMIDESMDKEQMKKPPQPWEFRSKPAWQRLIIMTGGVFVNLVLGILIYAMVLFAWGKEVLPLENAKYGIACDSLAMEIGLRDGDKILSVDNKPVESVSRIPVAIILETAQSIQIERGGEKMDLKITEDQLSRMVRNSKRSFFVEARHPFVVDSVFPGMNAEAAGIKKDDHIIAVDGTPTPYFHDFARYVYQKKHKWTEVTLVRNGDTLTKTLRPNGAGKVGITSAPDKFLDFNKIEYSFFGAFPAGLAEGLDKISLQVKQIGVLFTVDRAYESLGGFYSFGQVFDPEWDWRVFWTFTAFLSIVLAFMNILPIPALDGGHVMFLLYEMVTRRKPNEKVMEYAQYAGMMLLLVLMVYANTDWFRNQF